MCVIVDIVGCLCNLNNSQCVEWKCTYVHMAVVSSPAGSFLAGPVFTVIFGIVDVQSSE